MAALCVVVCSHDVDDGNGEEEGGEGEGGKVRIWENLRRKLLVVAFEGWFTALVV